MFHPAEEEGPESDDEEEEDDNDVRLPLTMLDIDMFSTSMNKNHLYYQKID